MNPKARLLWETIINSGNPFIELRKHAKEIDGDFLDIAKSEARRHTGIFIFTELAVEAIEIYEHNYTRQGVNTANLYRQPVQLVDDEGILGLKRTAKKLKNRELMQLVEEEELMQFVETYGENPDEFINILEEKLSRTVPSNEKGTSLLSMGIKLYNLSYPTLALKALNSALKYFVKNKDKEADCYMYLGAVYHSLGDFKKAIDFHEKSLDINEYMSNRTEKSKCYNNLGSVYHSLGDLRKAIDFYEKALEITKEIGDRVEEANSYMGLGSAYHSLGNLRKAIDFHEKALGTAKEIDKEIDKSIESKIYSYANLGAFSIESKCYANLGAFYHYDLGDFNKAIEFHKKALEIAVRVQNMSLVGKCYMNLGDDYYDLKNFDKADEFLNDVLKIAKGLGDKTLEVEYNVSSGRRLANNGFFKEAIESYKKALEIAKEIGELDSERIINLKISQIYGNYLDDLNLAYDHCKRSIEVSEVVSEKLVQEEYRIMFSSRISDTYQYMIPLCLKLKKNDDAFKYTEGSKSRAFLDLIATTEIKPSVEITNELKSLLDDEETYLANLREIKTRHLRQGQAKVSVEPGEVDRIFEKLNEIYDKIEKYDPEYVFTRRGKPLPLNKIQEILSSQKRDVVLIEYFITKDKTFIFVISSKDKELHIETVQISEEKLNQSIEVYEKEVVDYRGELGDHWLELSKYLIEPISEYP